MKMKRRVISGLITALMLVSLAVQAFASMLPFVDVKPGDWFYDAVSDVYERGLMRGDSETCFSPQGTTSRAMVVTVLARMSGDDIETPSYSPFIDVVPDSWYGAAVSWATSNGITTGYQDGSFRPDQHISREEMATFIYRYLDSRSLAPQSEEISFEDAADIASWASESVRALAGVGIIAGDERGRFNPQNGATRAETATLISRLCVYIENSADDEIGYIKTTIAKNCPRGIIWITGGYAASLTREYINRELRRTLGFDDAYTVSLFPGDYSIISTEYSNVVSGDCVQGEYEFDVHGPNGGFYRTFMTFIITKDPESYYSLRMTDAAELLEGSGITLRARSVESERLTSLIAEQLENSIGAPAGTYAFGAKLDVELTGGFETLAAEAAAASDGASVKRKITYSANAGDISVNGALLVTLRIPGKTIGSSNFTYDERVTVYVCDSTLSYTERLVGALSEDIDNVTVVAADQDNASSVFRTDAAELVVVVGADKAPLGTQDALAAYLSDGGRAMIVGGPLYGGGSDTDTVIDTVCPAYYETYPVSLGAALTADKDQVIVEDVRYTVPDEMFSCTYYTRGDGFARDRDFRQIPLIEIRDGKGLRSGLAAWITVFEGKSHRSGYDGALVGCFSAVDEKFYDANGIGAVVDAVEYMLLDSHLVEGGANEYAYFQDEDEDVTFGALVRYSPDVRGDVTVRTEIMSDDTVIAEVYRNLTEHYGKTSTLAEVSSVCNPIDGTFNRVVTTLFIDGVEVDRLSHEITLYMPKNSEDRNYIYAENGRLMCSGEPVVMYGVNYMPSNGKAAEDDYMHEFYFSRRAYDRNLVIEDLRRIKDIGFNAVSVFSYLDEEIASGNNILDFLALCEDMGLWVDMSLRISFDNAAVTERAIRTLRFDEFDIISAYDICWEGRLGNYEGTGYQNLGRKTLDPQWREWILNQYGSYSAAEGVFGTAIPRDSDGSVIGLSDAQMNAAVASDCEVRLAAAYRRFLDDAVARYWNGIAGSIRAIDPNHMLGFRMTALGSGEEGMYDLRSLAPVLDIMEPEGYILDSTEASCTKALFCNLYSRMVSPDTPIVWKEFGRSAWLGSNWRRDDAVAEDIGKLYEYSLDAMLEGYSSGVYCWYFAGGYRVGEGSDYGIINPDGSDRPCTAVLRSYAERFRNMGKIPEPDVYITVDRDEHANGIIGIYNKIAQNLTSARRENRTVALVTSEEAKSGILYADEVRDARLAEGADIGPLKYVNGMIRSACVEENGEGYTALLDVVNTSDAVWRDGSVSVVAEDGSVIYGTVSGELGPCRGTKTSIMIPERGVRVRFSVAGVLFGDVYTVG